MVIDVKYRALCKFVPQKHLAVKMQLRVHVGLVHVKTQYTLLYLFLSVMITVTMCDNRPPVVLTDMLGTQWIMFVDLDGLAPGPLDGKTTFMNYRK